MIAKMIGHVSLPRFLKSIGGLVRWSREVNTSLQQLRDRAIVVYGGRDTSGTASAITNCDFGSILEIPAEDPEDPPTYKIRGGHVNCGDQNWQFDNEDVDVGTDGRKLVYLSVDCESNQDDDEELILPGVKTGTKPTGPWSTTAYTGSENYPDNTNPEVGTGDGTIILPIGVLTVTEGIPTLNATGCGGFAVGQCGGTLSFSRL